MMGVLCVSIYVGVDQYMTQACVFESPWESGNLSVCFTITIKIVKIKIKKKATSENTKQKPTKIQNQKKNQKNKKTPNNRHQIPIILERDTFFLKDKKINRTVTVATHFSKDL